MFPGLSCSSSAARVAVISPSRRITSRSATRNGCASARMLRASVITWRAGRESFAGSFAGVAGTPLSERTCAGRAGFGTVFLGGCRAALMRIDSDPGASSRPHAQRDGWCSREARPAVGPYRQAASPFHAGRPRRVRASAFRAAAAQSPDHCAEARQPERSSGLPQEQGAAARLLLSTRSLVTRLLVTRSLVKQLQLPRPARSLPHIRVLFCGSF